MKTNNPIKEKSYNFALQIIKLYKYLKIESKEFIISKQLIRSGTAIGALVEEAMQAESKLDFIHKLSIANKEANETHYWLRLLKDSKQIGEKEFISIIQDCEEIMKLLSSIIKTTKLRNETKK